MLKRYAAGGLAVIALASLTAACGSDDSTAGGTSSDQPSVQESTSSPSSSEQSEPPSSSPPVATPVSKFCSHIDPHGDHPADAFMEISLFQASAARKTALAEARLMKGAVPPSAIARDFKAWRTFVQAVVRTTANGGSLESVSPLADRAQAAQQRLTDYAFDHCD